MNKTVEVSKTENELVLSYLVWQRLLAALQNLFCHFFPGNMTRLHFLASLPIRCDHVVESDQWHVRITSRYHLQAKAFKKRVWLFGLILLFCQLGVDASEALGGWGATRWGKFKSLNNCGEENHFASLKTHTECEQEINHCVETLHIWFYSLPQMSLAYPY